MKDSVTFVYEMGYVKGWSGSRKWWQWQLGPDEAAVVYTVSGHGSPVLPYFSWRHSLGAEMAVAGLEWTLPVTREALHWGSSSNMSSWGSHVSTQGPTVVPRVTVVAATVDTSTSSCFSPLACLQPQYVRSSRDAPQLNLCS